MLRLKYILCLSCSALEYVSGGFVRLGLEVKLSDFDAGL